MSIRLDSPFLAAPQSLTGLQINYGHPLTRGLRAVFLPGLTDRNLIDGQRLTDTNNDPQQYVKASPQHGRIWQGGGLRYIAKLSYCPAGCANWPVSVGAVARKNTTGSDALFSLAENSNNGDCIWLWTATQVRAFVRGATTGVTISGPSVANGELFCVTLVSAASNDHHLYVNGTDTSSSTDVGAAAFDNTAIGVYHDGSPGNHFDGDVGIVCIWDRALARAEADSFNRNPYQIFAPLTQLVGVEVAVAGGDMTATAASTFGSAADLDATGSLAATGAMTFGSAADLSATGAIAATGAMAFGSAADLDATGTLTATGAMAFAIAEANLTDAASSDMTATAAMSFGSAADLNATGTLAATAAMAFTTAADLKAQSEMTATAALTFGSSADLSAIGTLAATAAMAFTTSANLVNPDAVATLPSGRTCVLPDDSRTFQLPGASRTFTTSAD